MNVFYVGYLLSETESPHQAMIALYLARQGSQVNFFAWGNSEPPTWLSNYPFLEYHHLPKQGLLSALKYLFYLLKSFLQQRSDIDIIYVQGAQQTPFLFWIPWLKGKCKSVYHTQDYLEPGRYSFYETFERLFAKQADYVVSNEPNRARFMASNYQLEQMPRIVRTALPSWWSVPIRDENYRQQLLSKICLTQTKEPRLVVAGGAYRADRMGPELLDALSQLPENYILVFTWMLNGGNSRTECEQKVHSLKLENRVLFLDALSFSELLKLYACCDIGVLLYPNNGIGHFYQAPGRLTEYLRCGLPIVTSSFPGLELLVLKHNLGEVADPYQPISIAFAIKKIGSLSDLVLAERREYLRRISTDVFAYEKDASKVFDSILN